MTKARKEPTGVSQTSRGRGPDKKPRKKRAPVAKKQECQHAWSDPPIIRLAHYPVMEKEGVEAVSILVCWRCGAMRAEFEYGEEGKAKWLSS